MKKYMNYIAIVLYIVAVALYVSSIIFEGNRTIFMCFGSCAMILGALLTIKANKK